MKYALVTGGSRGIGRAVSCKLAEMGYFILINYQSNDAEAEKTLQLVQEKGSNGEIMKFDVTAICCLNPPKNGPQHKNKEPKFFLRNIRNWDRRMDYVIHSE